MSDQSDKMTEQTPVVTAAASDDSEAKKVSSSSANDKKKVDNDSNKSTTNNKDKGKDEETLKTNLEFAALADYVDIEAFKRKDEGLVFIHYQRDENNDLSALILCLNSWDATGDETLNRQLKYHICCYFGLAQLCEVALKRINNSPFCDSKEAPPKLFQPSYLQLSQKVPPGNYKLKKLSPVQYIPPQHLYIRDKTNKQDVIMLVLSGTVSLIQEMSLRLKLDFVLESHVLMEKYAQERIDIDVNNKTYVNDVNKEPVFRIVTASPQTEENTIAISQTVGWSANFGLGASGPAPEGSASIGYSSENSVQESLDTWQTLFRRTGHSSCLWKLEIQSGTKYPSQAFSSMAKYFRVEYDLDFKPSDGVPAGPQSDHLGVNIEITPQVTFRRFSDPVGKNTKRVRFPSLSRLCGCCVGCCQTGESTHNSQTFSLNFSLQPTAEKWSELYKQLNIKFENVKFPGRTHACPFDFAPKFDNLVPQLPVETAMFFLPFFHLNLLVNWH